MGRNQKILVLFVCLVTVYIYVTRDSSEAQKPSKVVAVMQPTTAVENEAIPTAIVVFSKVPDLQVSSLEEEPSSDSYVYADPDATPTVECPSLPELRCGGWQEYCDVPGYESCTAFQKRCLHPDVHDPSSYTFTVEKISDECSVGRCCMNGHNREGDVVEPDAPQW